ncbi:hypothetical protein FJ656_22560 [Schumannella luteola]|nr:hypothetical protein FJ656_22560 [Schumannella luteola]
MNNPTSHSSTAVPANTQLSGGDSPPGRSRPVTHPENPDPVDAAGVRRAAARLRAGLVWVGVHWADPPASRTQSGHCTPTGARIWHSGQMVRPQRWQSTQLCRSGWR